MTHLHICVTIKTCFYPSCIHKLKSEMGIYPLSTLTLLQSVTPIEELAQLLWKVAILSSAVIPEFRNCEETRNRQWRPYGKFALEINY